MTAPARPHSGTGRPQRSPRSRRTLIVLASVLAFSGLGVAWAAWTTSGSGPANAKAVTAVTVSVTADTGQTADLYPGGPAGTLYFKVDNQNPFPVTFTDMTPGVISVDAGHSGCASSNISVAGRTGLSISVPANTAPDSAVARSIASAVSMSTSAPDACQGAVFTIALSLTGTSS